MRFFTLLLFIPIFSFSQNIDPLRTKDEQAQTRWVDSIYKTMSLEQKIGQLFMVQAFSSHTAKQQKPIKELVKKYQRVNCKNIKGRIAIRPYEINN